MKFTAFALAAAATFSLAFIAPKPTAMTATTPAAAPGTVYDFTVKTIDGKDVKLSKYKGKKILIVNTASKCGYTPQYKELEELSKKYGKKVTVLGFPSNSFNQELASNEEVSSFCEKNYGVTFPMFGKTTVVRDDATPLFVELGAPDWNFNKYLLDRRGRLQEKWGASTTPDDPELVDRIDALLSSRT